MHVGRACRSRDGFVFQIFRELAGHELAGVVQLQLSHDAHSLSATGLPTLQMEFSLATDVFTRASASLFFLRK
eukprot:scaffold90085_cov36-Phaeocystis_antarctica.AAC.5